MADISLEIRRLKMSDKDKYKFNLRDGLDQWVMMIFFMDIGALFVVLIVAFFGNGLGEFSFKYVAREVFILVLLSTVGAFVWTLILAYLKYKRSNKKVNNFRCFSVIVKITLGKGFLMKVHDIDYWRYGG